MVIEGRTWWYKAKRGYGFEPACEAEFALSIGKEVEIDGVAWHEVNVTLSGKREFEPGEDRVIWHEWEYDNSSRCVSYMREENGNVYVYNNPEILKNYEFVYCYWENGSALMQSTEPCLLYRSGNVGDTFVQVWDGDEMISTITGVSTVESCGSSFKTYNYSNRMMDYLGNDRAEGIKYIEGIGMLSYPSEYVHCGQLLILPLNLPYAGYLYLPELRYVTDAQGEIIFDCRGGLKLWEKYDEYVQGIAGVVVDATEDVRWYDLRGVGIDRPSVPGIYIRVVGGKACKVTVE